MGRASSTATQLAYPIRPYARCMFFSALRIDENHHIRLHTVPRRNHPLLIRLT